MNEGEQLKQDVREGRIDSDRLVELVMILQRKLQEANRRIEELEKKLGSSGRSITEPFIPPWTTRFSTCVGRCGSRNCRRWKERSTIIGCSATN
jgi:hypothetical protein